MKKSLYSKLKEYAAKTPLRMHMPGHKGRKTSCVDNADTDITEITGFDNLHQPQGVLKESMQYASKLWGSERSFYLVNGSTCGILAGIRALTKRGDCVLVARNCHRAVYHALEICGLFPTFLMPPIIEDWQIFGSVTPQSVKEALDKNPEISLVIITSPTYEGVISDVEQICRIAHARGVRVLVDEAHGAHLSLDEYFEKSSVRCGADIVVQSLHKTLDCPTQTAIMHVGADVDINMVMHQIAVFETSSPSYHLLAAVDKFVRKALAGKAPLSEWTYALNEFYEKTATLQNIQILANTVNDIHGIYAYDKSKIILRCRDIAGLAKRMSEVYNTEFEMVCQDFIIAMTGAGDCADTLGLFADILLEEDSLQKKFSPSEKIFLYHIPVISKNAEEALASKQKLVALDSAAGKTAGEYVWEYPPGIPILIPGEIIPESFVQSVKNDLYVRITSQNGELPERISVLL